VAKRSPSLGKQFASSIQCPFQRSGLASCREPFDTTSYFTRQPSSPAEDRAGRLLQHTGSIVFLRFTIGDLIWFQSLRLWLLVQPYSSTHCLMVEEQNGLGCWLWRLIFSWKRELNDGFWVLSYNIVQIITVSFWMLVLPTHFIHMHQLPWHLYAFSIQLVRHSNSKWHGKESFHFKTPGNRPQVNKIERSPH